MPNNTCSVNDDEVEEKRRKWKRWRRLYRYFVGCANGLNLVIRYLRYDLVVPLFKTHLRVAIFKWKYEVYVLFLLFFFWVSITSLPSLRYWTMLHFTFGISFVLWYRIFWWYNNGEKMNGTRIGCVLCAKYKKLRIFSPRGWCCSPASILPAQSSIWSARNELILHVLFCIQIRFRKIFN